MQTFEVHEIPNQLYSDQVFHLWDKHYNHANISCVWSLSRTNQEMYAFKFQLFNAAPYKKFCSASKWHELIEQSTVFTPWMQNKKYFAHTQECPSKLPFLTLAISAQAN